MHAGAHMVKLEGGGWTTDTVRFLVERGIPVCAHLGLTPQTVHALGGYRVQGRSDSGRLRLKRRRWSCRTPAPPCWCWKWCPPHWPPITAQLQALPHHRHRRRQGHGRAGAGDARHAGHQPGQNPKFVRNFMAGAQQRARRHGAYVAAVKDGSFPDDQLHAW
jgi:3-methyl-2-oxobutanoate hydroxymethyltransferase